MKWSKTQKAVLLACFLFFTSCMVKKSEYVCPPCNSSCDELSFQEPGECPHCKMTLIKRSDLIEEANLKVNDINIKTGSGVFLIEGANGRAEKTIKVYYHKPENFNSTSQVLIVIPGTGRDGDEYRDAWKEASEKHSLLILSPKYEENDYPFEDYHLGGAVDKINIEEALEVISGTNEVLLKENKLEYSINANKSEWLFNDFDRIFDAVVEKLQLPVSQYDIFGHSAGGQILHRMAILSNSAKVNRLIAANSGFYTLPKKESKYPFGIAKLNLTDEHLSAVFGRRLIIMVGELDNENETHGTLLRSATIDLQGIHRLERAEYFFDFSKTKADKIQANFNWSLQIIPKTGHDFRKMTQAAARVLYEPKETHK